MKSGFFVLGAALLGLIGLLFSVTYDLDNVYDLTATTSWLFTACVRPLDAFLGRRA